MIQLSVSVFVASFLVLYYFVDAWWIWNVINQDQSSTVSTLYVTFVVFASPVYLLTTSCFMFCRLIVCCQTKHWMLFSMGFCRQTCISSTKCIFCRCCICNINSLITSSGWMIMGIHDRLILNGYWWRIFS